MKRFLFLLIIGALTVLVACGDQSESQPEENMEHDNHGNHEEETDDSLIPLKVDVLVEDEVQLGEVTLQARVTHDGEPVSEADEVNFEVWEVDHEDDSKTVEASYTEDGIYEATFTFEETGSYEMYAHVTAKAQHTMPKKAIEVVEE
ncbi:FixH family protein [Tenuibacillus multivorans]|uniref:YtkA-like n=1 Tax=Tenuibacillus multivorans TaxID=237069 RepID=A0A1H0AMX2_9BACI|nr:FixH family protein [Tenuibacillus multivorans]GEL78208.1 hypothetical protein TMU01_24430 [Tenuibacillus multivorans]SDN34749.1 YtkA-like [Tenuibacillus multivorans]